MVGKFTIGQVVTSVEMNNIKVGAQGWGILFQPGIPGFRVEEKGAGANMSVDVRTGKAKIASVSIEVVGTTNVAVASAHATLDRFDIVVLSNIGTISVREGTAAADPVVEDYNLESNESILLAILSVPAADTAIEDAQITNNSITMTNTTQSVTANALETTYRNTDPGTKLVTITVFSEVTGASENAYIIVLSDSSTPPTTEIGRAGNDATGVGAAITGSYNSITFAVLPLNYYRVEETTDAGAATLTLTKWTEVDIPI